MPLFPPSNNYAFSFFSVTILNSGLTLYTGVIAVRCTGTMWQQTSFAYCGDGEGPECPNFRYNSEVSTGEICNSPQCQWYTEWIKANGGWPIS
ncbi:hypothetical protein QBC46DRAFT_352239 [Diplogelasinospora grovesii]|uniref:Uncharacterized protein n=1 Tax=Diplogelasinospora grovesii TaxID=303347 RepID=A0AAN6NB36_9PEZI|nr:hypothetical protein QBC46DRAFT_352239 [Diplogelasinospora grovesii]